jgi:hypothetical protein
MTPVTTEAFISSQTMQGILEVNPVRLKPVQFGRLFRGATEGRNA